jgi:hypothetical protein
MAKRSKAKPPPLEGRKPNSVHGVTEKQLIAALRKWGGIKALAAQECGITRQTVQIRVDKSPNLQAAIKEIEEETLDIGEGHIVKGVRDGDSDYVWGYMRAKGKKRGYGNKVENSFDEQQLEAIVSALGGDPAKFAAALRSLGVDPDQA